LGSGLVREEAMQDKLNQWLQGALETLMLAHGQISAHHRM
jgi:hypothetical protein